MCVLVCVCFIVIEPHITTLLSGPVGLISLSYSIFLPPRRISYLDVTKTSAISLLLFCNFPFCMYVRALQGLKHILPSKEDTVY